MGGLISRYFIEQLGGNKVIQKLVMLGTPNAGSPWSTVQAWATSAVAVGINLLGTVAWPIKAVASLVGMIEKIDQNLDDMQFGSEVLDTLKGSSDPGVAYVLICGFVLLAAQKRPLLERLIKKLGTETIFLAQANDIAASVSSAMSVDGRRSPMPEKFDTIACDHLSYFRTSVGIAALNQALGQTLGKTTQGGVKP
jgi:hypothetical protein